MLICNDEPDLILITEVIPKAQQLPLAHALPHISGYTRYANFPLSMPNLGCSGNRGVCIYAAHHLRVSEVSLDSSSVEHVWISILLRGSDRLLLGSCYRSPSCTGEEHACHLDQLFQQASSLSFSHLVIVGDFNLPQIDWETKTSHAPPSHLSHTFLDIVHDCLLY